METKENSMELKSKSPQQNQMIEQYNNDGWIIIKNFFSKKEVKNAKIKIENFLKKNYKNYKGRDINFVGNEKKYSRINTFHKLHDSKWVKNLARQNKIKKTVQSLLNTKTLQLRASELFAKPKNFGLKVPIHQDNYYWNVIGGKALTIWIALSPSSKKNGGIFYFNESHKKGIFPHKPSYAKGSSQTIKNLRSLKKFKKVFPKLEVGDALIHSCLVVHGSHKNKSNTSRKGLTFQFKSKKSKYNLSLIKQYEKKLQEQIDLREK